VDTAAETLFQLHNANAAVCSLVHKPKKTAAVSFFDCHFWHHGNPCAGCDHRQNRCKLPALKDHIGMQACASAGRQCAIAKAMAFLEQKKWIGFDLLEVNALLGCQPVIVRNDNIKPFAKKFM